MKSNIKIDTNDSRLPSSYSSSNKTNTLTVYTFGLIGITVILNLCLHFDTYHPNLLMKGASFTNSTQKIMLLITAFSFYNLRRWRKDIKNALVFVSAIFMVVFLYKSNYWIKNVFHVPWYLPAMKFFAIAALLVFRNGVETLHQLKQLFSNHSAVLAVASLFMLLALVGFFNMNSVWQHLLLGHYSTSLMTTISESTQLAFFSFIAIEAIKVRRSLKN
ncbi:hypothetical protein M9194_05270 [Vibrio sp. S4M6]|uniref:hypothetical protein n=1 Tax=Vibrio sinus TaxID=2946865 RepID=UPI002029C967|nr:hypothetical protein [Vibrio sinus]MCL9780850.1 hypothetical protein [Vibrio sinus]